MRPFRKIVFQLHLWLGVLLGIYVALISITGSAVVFRPEFTRWQIPQTVPSTVGDRLSGDALAAAIDGVYRAEGLTVVRFSEPPRADQPVTVRLARGDAERGRLFDPYTATDLGDSYPASVRAMEWLVALHDELLGGFQGRRVNGLLGGVVALLVLSGAVIWWPGRRQWRKSLYATPGMSRPLWHLHSAVGFWIFLLLFNWALSGWYMGVPGPVEALKDWLDNNPDDFVRPLDGVTRFLTTAHFGRFGGTGVGILWSLLGLLPAVLFVTGFVVWWRRVVRPRLRAAV